MEASDDAEGHTNAERRRVPDVAGYRRINPAIPLTEQPKEAYSEVIFTQAMHIEYIILRRKIFIYMNALLTAHATISAMCAARAVRNCAAASKLPHTVCR